jgi:hypothetical protein
MRRSAIALLAAITLSLVPAAARAQIGLVFQGNWADDIPGAGATSAGGIGAGVRVPLGTWTQQSGMMGQMTFDWFFAKDHAVGDQRYQQRYWEVNMNGVVDVKPLKVVYVGTGLVYTDQEVSTSVNVPDANGSHLGLNLIGGLRFGTRKNGIFFQARYEVGGGKLFVATGGIYVRG